MNPRIGERGQALVEFCLASIVFMTLFFGIISMGQALYTYDLTAQAARVGSRWAIVNTPKPTNDCATSTGTCQAAIVSHLVSNSGLKTANLTTTITFGGTGQSASCSTQPSVGCWINVKLQYKFSSWALVRLPAATFTSSSQMVIASQY